MNPPKKTNRPAVTLEQLCTLNIHIKGRPTMALQRSDATKIIWHRAGNLASVIGFGLDKGTDQEKIVYLAHLVRASILGTGRDLKRVFQGDFPRARAAQVRIIVRRSERLPDMITVGRLATIYVYSGNVGELQQSLRDALQLEDGQDSQKAAA